MKLLEKKPIKIGDKEYFVWLCVRAMMKYEKLSGHSISEVKTLQDRIYIFYCSLNQCHPEIAYEQFLDIINPYPDAVGEFMNMSFEEVTGKKPKVR